MNKLFFTWGLNENNGFSWSQSTIALTTLTGTFNGIELNSLTFYGEPKNFLNISVKYIIFRLRVFDVVSCITFSTTLKLGFLWGVLYIKLDARQLVIDNLYSHMFDEKLLEQAECWLVHGYRTTASWIKKSYPCPALSFNICLQQTWAYVIRHLVTINTTLFSLVILL